MQFPPLAHGVAPITGLLIKIARSCWVYVWLRLDLFNSLCIDIK